MQSADTTRERQQSTGAMALVCTLALAVCGTTPALAEKTVSLTVEASGIPAFVAEDRGLFKGIKVNVSEVGYAQVQALLLSGDTDIAWVSPIETVQFVAEGTPFKYFSTAGAQNMYNGVVVQAEDAEKYSSITDLKGKTLGIPGYGTGTWAAFQAFARAFYGIENPRSAFNIITADSGALLALVEQGEIDAALLFSGTSAAARSLPQFHTIFSFTEAMQKKTGQPLAVNGAVATAQWLEQNPKAAERVVEGLERATDWIEAHPDAFAKGGEYADLAEAAGWLEGAETTSTVQRLISEGKWFLNADDYTKEWIDAIVHLADAGNIVEELPPTNEVFLPPGKLKISE